MINIHSKTLADLEFPTVLTQVSELCVTQLGKSAVENISPFSQPEAATHALQETNEFVASFANENRIPNHGFSEINKELKLLKVENTVLELESFRKILF